LSLRRALPRAAFNAPQRGGFGFGFGLGSVTHGPVSLVSAADRRPLLPSIARGFSLSSVPPDGAAQSSAESDIGAADEPDDVEDQDAELDESQEESDPLVDAAIADFEDLAQVDDFTDEEREQIRFSRPAQEQLLEAFPEHRRTLEMYAPNMTVADFRAKIYSKEELKHMLEQIQHNTDEQLDFQHRTFGPFIGEPDPQELEDHQNLSQIVHDLESAALSELDGINRLSDEELEKLAGEPDHEALTALLSSEDRVAYRRLILDEQVEEDAAPAEEAAEADEEEDDAGSESRAARERLQSQEEDELDEDIDDDGKAIRPPVELDWENVGEEIFSEPNRIDDPRLFRLHMYLHTRMLASAVSTEESDEVDNDDSQELRENAEEDDDASAAEEGPQGGQQTEAGDDMYAEAAHALGLIDDYNREELDEAEYGMNFVSYARQAFSKSNVINLVRQTRELGSGFRDEPPFQLPIDDRHNHTYAEDLRTYRRTEQRPPPFVVDSPILTDAAQETIYALNTYDPESWSYQKLAETFNSSTGYIRSVCRLKAMEHYRRAQGTLYTDKDEKEDDPEEVEESDFVIPTWRMIGHPFKYSLREFRERFIGDFESIRVRADDDAHWRRFLRWKVPPRKKETHPADAMPVDSHLPVQRPPRYRLVFSDISTRGENLVVRVRERDGTLRNPTEEELIRAIQIENPWHKNRQRTIGSQYW